MKTLSTQRFSINNVDCASCAARIEQELQGMEGVTRAVFDFANLTLHVTARDMDQVIAAVQRLEPGMELTPKANGSGAARRAAPSETLSFRRGLWILAGASALFFLQLTREHFFQTSWPVFLQFILVAAAYLAAGWNVLRGAYRTIRKRVFFDENVLMVIATAGAIAIGAFSEAIGVMIFYKVGELLQNKAIAHSRRSIHGLLAEKPISALVRTRNGYLEKAPEAVVVGEVILVKPGEKVPLDGLVISGRSQLDTAALTGEFTPVGAGPGDLVMAGQINQNAALTIRVLKPYKESSIARLMELVENATARKAATEKFITAFARYYTPGVVLIAAALAFVPALLTPAKDLHLWVYRALVLLVISCPCALVVSIPLGYFGGIGRASRNGILVKGSNYIDAMSAVDTVVFDKTGTLTKGVFKVKQVVAANGFSHQELLTFAAVAEFQSTHPIATSIAAALRQNGGRLNADEISEHKALNGHGVSARYGGHTILVGNDALLHEMDIAHTTCDFDTTVAHIVVNGLYAGHILIDDQIHPEAGAAVRALRLMGIDHIAMLTGDNARAAGSVAQELGLDAYHAGLSPEDKVSLFETIKASRPSKGKIAFVGDGLNDAPVLARADVGVAMGGLGSDAAIETADVVLMGDSPLKIVEALRIARQTRRIVWQNIVLAFAIKGVFIIFGAMGVATMWEAVFADMGAALLAVANATRAPGGGHEPQKDGKKKFKASHARAAGGADQ